MRSCCAEPSEGVGVREAERKSLPARCGRWLRDHLRLCLCVPRSPEREPEPSVHGTEVPKRRAPRTGVRRKGRKHTGRVEPAPNTSRSAPEATLPPEDADQPTTGQRLPRSQPGSITGDTLTASSCNGGHDKGPEEDLRKPYPSCRMGQARRPAWEPEHVPCAIDASQLSSTLARGIRPAVTLSLCPAPEPRQTQLAPETWGGPASSPEPVQELPETPVLERRPVSPASAPAEPEDVPAVASAQGPGPELEPHEPSGLGPRALAGMAPGVAEPGPGPEPTGPCAASPWDIPGLVSGPELEPRESSGAGPVSPAGMAQGLAEPEVVLEPTSPCAVSTRDLPRERVRTILAFAPRLVAEQLTLMCAELYSRVECGECKVYVERQPLREAIVLLAPNILNVIRQFGTTFHWVISSCLRAPSRMAQDRARVVEFWIQVAKECLALRNFESFRAIIFALQRPPVRRLESTWAHVSWKSSWIYKKLKKRNKGLKGKQLLKEARAMLRRWPPSPRASQDMKTQGMIPPLGLILYEALEKQQEHHVDVTDFLEEIVIYRFLARQYDLEPKEHFLSFFQRLKLLREEQSYGLSYHLEPPGQRAGRKGLLKFFRSLKI
ncbi:ral-GDS-related protein-like [Manis pentadactyla]|uniref:ral-GDS-related protein-like n=1 Tax=Manis pentadactyla TaxID=143292 RepID=UPI00255CFD59|nr:ral-GDS-related protein-like [Manis pentadactyla]